jgi:hypothetical protein
MQGEYEVWEASHEAAIVEALKRKLEQKYRGVAFTQDGRVCGVRDEIASLYPVEAVPPNNPDKIGLWTEWRILLLDLPGNERLYTPVIGLGAPRVRDLFRAALQNTPIKHH